MHYSHAYEFAVGTVASNQSVTLSWSTLQQQVTLNRIEWRFAPPRIQETLIPEEIAALAIAVEDYFDSGRAISSIPWNLLNLDQASDFQKQVYRAITKIPHGETRTYGWVAAQTRNPQASRAVGQALKNNPFPILIPCHRVVASKSLGGFMGCDDPNQPELKLKKALLSLEERYRNPVFSFLKQSSAFFLGDVAPPLGVMA